LANHLGKLGHLGVKSAPTSPRYPMPTLIAPGSFFASSFMRHCSGASWQPRARSRSSGSKNKLLSLGS